MFPRRFSPVGVTLITAFLLAACESPADIPSTAEGQPAALASQEASAESVRPDARRPNQYAWVGKMHNELIDSVARRYAVYGGLSRLTVVSAMQLARDECTLFFRNKSIQYGSACAWIGAARGQVDVVMSGDTIYPSPLLQWYYDQLDALAAQALSPEDFADEVDALVDMAYTDLYGEELDVFLATASVAVDSAYYWSYETSWTNLDPEMANRPSCWQNGAAAVAGMDLAGVWWGARTWMAAGAQSALAGAVVVGGGASLTGAVGVVFACLGG